MLINSHGHIFNFKSVFSERTLKILKSRLIEEYNVPEPVAKALAATLRIIFDVPASSSETFNAHNTFIGLLPDRLRSNQRNPSGDAATDNPDRVDQRDFEMDKFVQAVAMRLNVPVKTIIDWAELIGIGLLPDMARVADHLMEQVDDQDIVVALMMNIADGGNSDNEIFQKQGDDTVRQAERYPGRILPFYAFHPHRPDAMRLFQKEFFDTQGNDKPARFVGLKLYPSLGYQVTDQSVQKVLEYCDQLDLPVLMHCSKGGFYYKKKFISYSDPCHWEKILGSFEGKLKICFAHFGGEGEFNEGGAEEQSKWWRTIKRLMVKFNQNPACKSPSGGVYKERSVRVFADISSHTSVVENPEMLKSYKLVLDQFLGDNTLASGVLWGSDFWVNRMACRETTYRDFFLNHFGTHMPRIGVTNPSTFLGLPIGNRPIGTNMERHIAYLKSVRERLNLNRAANWVLAELERA